MYLCSCKIKECFYGTMFIKYMIIKHTVYIHWKYMSWNNDIIIWNTKLIKIYTKTQYKTDLNVCVEINHSPFLNPGFQFKSWKSSLQYHKLHLCAVNLNEHWSINAIPGPGMGAHTYEMTGTYNTLSDKMAAILADDNIKCIFVNENDKIPIRISLKFVPRSPIDNKPALV